MRGGNESMTSSVHAASWGTVLSCAQWLASRNPDMDFLREHVVGDALWDAQRQCSRQVLAALEIDGQVTRTQQTRIACQCWLRGGG